MIVNFDWDPEKAKVNYKKHGVSFIEAASTFGDPLAITIYDEHHSQEEDRYITLGYSDRQRLLVVIHTEKSYNTRIISARVATNKERRIYDEG